MVFFWLCVFSDLKGVTNPSPQRTQRIYLSSFFLSRSLCCFKWYTHNTFGYRRNGTNCLLTEASTSHKAYVKSHPTGQKKSVDVAFLSHFHPLHLIMGQLKWAFFIVYVFLSPILTIFRKEKVVKFDTREQETNIIFLV